MKAALIIPALNEESALGEVLQEIPEGLFQQVIVADNGSTDRTSEVAISHGAVVVAEPRRGYGNACLKALTQLREGTDVVAFMDGDGSDVAAELETLLKPIEEGRADLVLGSRELGEAERGAMNVHQRFGNLLATFFVRLLFGHHYTDLGPFRAIRVSSLETLDMCDRNYGWTIEMQIKALRAGLRVLEVPVSYRQRRAGVSKVSGNVWGSFAAGVKILWTIVRLRFAKR